MRIKRIDINLGYIKQHTYVLSMLLERYEIKN